MKKDKGIITKVVRSTVVKVLVADRWKRKKRNTNSITQSW